MNAYLQDLKAGNCEAAHSRLATGTEQGRLDWIARCEEVTTGRLADAILNRTHWKVTRVKVEGERARVDVDWTSPDAESAFAPGFAKSVDVLAVEVADILSAGTIGSPSPAPTDKFMAAVESALDEMTVSIERGDVAQVTTLFVFDVAREVDGEWRILFAPIPAP